MPTVERYGEVPIGCHPDDFRPDMNVCRPKEIAAWERAKLSGMPLLPGHQWGIGKYRAEMKHPPR